MLQTDRPVVGQTVFGAVVQLAEESDYWVCQRGIESMEGF